MSCTCHPQDGLRYVGMTSHGAQKRFRSHISAARSKKDRPKAPVVRWIAEHGVENVYYVILEELDSLDQMCSAEELWINEYRGQGAQLLNVERGGIIKVKPGSKSNRQYALGNRNT